MPPFKRKNPLLSRTPATGRMAPTTATTDCWNTISFALFVKLSEYNGPLPTWLSMGSAVLASLVSAMLDRFTDGRFLIHVSKWSLT